MTGFFSSVCVYCLLASLIAVTDKFFGLVSSSNYCLTDSVSLQNSAPPQIEKTGGLISDVGLFHICV